MRLLIIRHGDPDYEHDTLTKRGWVEAEVLSRELCRVPVDDYYVSTLGRAKDTASLTLKKVGRTATECDWLKEFPARIIKPDCPDEPSIVWDWLPQDWTREPLFFSKDRWMEHPAIANSDTREKYKYVIKKLDELLSGYGYEREDNFYRAVKPNNKTIVFFCHFGLESVLLSHLLNISPMLLWHGTCAAPTSVTTVVTEERRPGVAYFRMTGFGDVSHLYKNNVEPSPSARFCEIYGSPGERVD